MRPSTSKPRIRDGKSRPAGGGETLGVQPARIHLLRDRDIEWAHRPQVAATVRDLREVGFETITTFRIAEIDGLYLVGLAHPQAGYLAVVYDHRLAAVWCNLVAVYKSGETLTVSNASRGRQLEPIPGHEKHLRRGASIAGLYKSFKRHLRQEPRERIEPKNFVRVFEDAYAREVAWRSAGEAPRPAAERHSDDRRCAPLFAAVAARDPVRLRELVGSGLPLEGRDAYGRTPLMAAAAGGDPRSAEVLLAAGADVNARAAGLPGDALGGKGGSQGVTTPLTTAIETGDADIVTLLLAAGANFAGHGELAPLQFAAQQGDAEVVAAILAAGAEVDRRSEDGMTPLLTAAGEGYLDVVEILVLAGADVELRCEKETAITLAAAAGARDVVEYLAPRVKPRLRRRAEKLVAAAGLPPDPQARRLMQAAMNGKAAMVKRLLEAGVHPDAVELREKGEKPATPLMAATQEGHLEAMRLLISAGADVNYADGHGTPLKRALNPIFMDADKQPAVIRLLIESGADFEHLRAGEKRLLAQALKGA